MADISPHPPIPRDLRKTSLTQDSDDRIGDRAGRETHRRHTVDFVQKSTISETEKKKKTNNKIATDLEAYFCDCGRNFEDPAEYLSMWRAAGICMLNS